MSGSNPIKGQAIRWTPKQRKELSQVTGETIVRARRAWKKYASPKFKSLLDAKPDDGTK